MSQLSFRFAGHILKEAAHKFFADDCFTLASSISFIFLFSLIPLSTISLFFLNMSKGFFFPAGIDSSHLIDLLAEETVRLIPFVSKQWVRYSILQPRPYSSFNIANFFLLPVISGFVFQALEGSYRKIFSLPYRNLIFSQIFYAAISILTVLVLFTINFAWIVLSTIGSYFNGMLAKVEHIQQLYTSALQLFNPLAINILSFLALLILFLISQKFFLNIRIRFYHSLAAGIVFCLLWFAARFGFGIYLHHISKINLLYGSLSSIAITLLWIFYSSVALLYSVEFMYVLHRWNHSKIPHGPK